MSHKPHQSHQSPRARHRRIAARWAAGLVAVVLAAAGALLGAGPAGATVGGVTTSMLTLGEHLNVGDSLTSPDGRFALYMQADGNLVEYEINDGIALWSTVTWGTGATQFYLQGDGNLVVYTPSFKAVWSSGTYGKSAAELALQNDGNLVLYSSTGVALWDDGIQLADTLLPGMSLHDNQFLQSPNGEYTAVLQGDGNFVEYGPTGAIFWTNTYGSPGDVLIFQGDGNLVLYSASGVALWASWTFGAPSQLAMQSDGNLVLYDTSGNPEWASKQFTPNGYVFGNYATWNITGRGNGHGHGLSQWGAYGAAAAGLTWNGSTPSTGILAFYYPGTTQTPGYAATPVRVDLDMDSSGGYVTVGNTATLQVSDTGTAAAPASYPGYTQLRAAYDSASGKQRLQGLSGSAWTNVGGLFTGNVKFVETSPTNPVVHLFFADGTAMDFRGAIVATSSTSAATVYPVNVLPLDQYVQGVLPREMPSSWLPDALDAQAVAIRTYALYELQHSSTQPYDICSTTNCQAYGGYAAYNAAGQLISGLGEATTTNQAVAATSGVVLDYCVPGASPAQCSTAFTQYSAANGGYSTYGGQPYLPAQADPYDGYLNNSSHAWTAQLSAAEIKAAYPQLAFIEWVVITSRDGNGDLGGRVNTVVVQGLTAARTNIQVSISGSALAAIAGFPTNWFGFS